jgi:hypothetical protein
VTHFLYLIRHGEASPHDGPLSEVGREQARLAGQRLAQVPLAAIRHGPLLQPGVPPSLISFNDAGHLPPALGWTGFPSTATPPSG